MVPPCGGRGRGERGGPTVWRKRERGGATVRRKREGGEGWSHHVEEEGEEERGGTTVWRKRERGRGVVPPCGGRVREGEGAGVECSDTCSAVSLAVQCHLL